MKRISLTILFAAVVISSCDVKSDEPVRASTGSLPIGAEQTPYEDNPDLVDVAVKNNLGILSERGNYLKGFKHGPWTEYHSNGIPSNITHYDLGVMEGISVTIDETGQILTSTTYHNGLKHGPSLEYIRSRVKTEMNFQNDKLEGLVKSYYPSGTLMEEAMYEDGKRDGVSRWFDMNGNMTIEYEYKDGELVSND